MMDETWQEQQDQQEEYGWDLAAQEEAHFYQTVADFAELIRVYGEELVYTELWKQTGEVDIPV